METMVEEYKIVEAIPPKTTSSAVVGDYISFKNGAVLHVAVQLTQAAGHATPITIEKATNVAGTGSVAIDKPVQIWANEDTAASDTLVRKADAVSYTVANDVKNKLVIFKIDAATLGEGYTTIVVKTGASAQATNFVAAQYYLGELRYEGDQSPSAIVD